MSENALPPERFIKLKVHPESRQSLIKETARDAYEIWVKPPAERGLANAAALALLAQRFQCPTGRFRIIKGAHSPAKIVRFINRRSA